MLFTANMRAAHAAADATPSPAPVIDRSIDVKHSHAEFSVTHMYVSKVTGSVPIVSATISLPPGSAIPAHVSGTFDPTRINTHDPDRDDSLQGPDWFDTEHFPLWRFSDTGITPTSDTTFTVNGMLTIHGVTQPVSIKATVVRGLPKPVYHAQAELDRRAFGMRITPIDGMIGNDLELTLDIIVR